MASSTPMPQGLCIQERGDQNIRERASPKLIPITDRQDQSNGERASPWLIPTSKLGDPKPDNSRVIRSPTMRGESLTQTVESHSNDQELTFPPTTKAAADKHKSDKAHKQKPRCHYISNLRQHQLRPTLHQLKLAKGQTTETSQRRT